MQSNEIQTRLLAKEGNSDAFESLFQQYLPVMYKLRRNYYVRDLESDDWLQESRIIFLKSLETFDEQHGLSFGYFYKMNLERHIFSLLRRQGALKRTADRLSSSLEAKIEEQGDFLKPNFNLFQHRMIDNLMIREQLKYFDGSLSKFERAVFYQYVDGNSFEVIALDTNKTPSQIKNAFDRIKRKFKDFLNCS